MSGNLENHDVRMSAISASLSPVTSSSMVARSTTVKAVRASAVRSAALATSPVPPEDGWKTMESAPLHGLIDLWVVYSQTGARRVADVSLQDGAWRDTGGNNLSWSLEDDKQNVTTSTVTHWRPLPVPPLVREG